MKSDENSKFSIRSRATDRLILDMIETVKNSNENRSPFIVLVLDEFTTKILSSYVSMSELLRLGIFSVEDINKLRKSYPNYSVIYFLSSTKQSCELVVSDFSDASNPKYGDVHLFFAFRLLNTLMEILVHENLGFRVKTFKELNLAFFSSASQACLRSEEAIQLFSLQSSNSTGERNKICNSIKERVVTLFASMKEYPYIQYQNTKICSDFAQLLNGDLFDLFDSKYLNSERKTVCLILDRSFDLATPVLHDYSYRCLVHDFFNLNEENCLSLPSEKIEFYKLDEGDQIWCKYKNTHIGEVFNSISDDSSELMNSDLSKAKNSNLENFEQMIEAVKGRNEYKDKYNKIKTHLTLCNKIMNVSADFYYLLCFFRFFQSKIFMM